MYEAMRTMVDLINLSSSAPLDDDVPERVWIGKDVSYKHLTMFGCRTYIHIPKDEISKLDYKFKPCIFLEYSHEEFGYRLYDPKEKVIRSKDVVFLEDQTLQDPESNEMSDLTPDFLVTEHQTPAPDTQGHGGDTEEYDDAADDAADDDDGHNHDHHTLGDPNLMTFQRLLRKGRG